MRNVLQPFRHILLREVFLDSAKSVAQHLWIGLQVRDACAQQD